MHFHNFINKKSTDMKKFLSMLSFMLLAGTGLAGANVTVVSEADMPSNPIRKIVSSEDILVEENFDAFVDNDRNYEYPVAFNGSFIDPELMHGAEWSGHRVYSGEGTCLLMSGEDPTNPANHARIYTPLGDYSGSITVSFKAKCLYQEVTLPDGEIGVATGSSVRIGLVSASGIEFDVDTYDGSDTYGGYIIGDVRLYEKQGWARVTVTFDNYTAANDAAIMISTESGAELDDIVITTSAEKFIAAPIISSITDITETSFTVNFEPVRKAFSYWTYLYTLEGYDEDGNPFYMPVLSPEEMEMLEEYGLTVEEYLEMLEAYPPYENNVYNMYGLVESYQPCSFTFTGLDPAKDYYYVIRSHYMFTFSGPEMHFTDFIAAPELAEASNISNNGFTAAWSPIVKADSYDVTLYGVDIVEEDNDEYLIFEEDFENVTAFTNATDIYDPTVVNSDSDITADDLTTAPGWEIGKTYYLVEGKFGLDSSLSSITTPAIYVEGSDEVAISLRLESMQGDFRVRIGFAGALYEVPCTDGYMDEYVILPTNGAKESKITLSNPDGIPLFIDYIAVTQDLKKGDKVFSFMGTSNVTDATTCDFSNLDSSLFGYYGYSVKAVRGEGKAAIYSEENDRMIVDLANGKSFTGLTAIEAVAPGEVYEVARYSIDGSLLQNPCKGINIVRYSDGSTKKVFVR